MARAAYKNSSKEKKKKEENKLKKKKHKANTAIKKGKAQQSQQRLRRDRDIDGLTKQRLPAQFECFVPVQKIITIYLKTDPNCRL